ALPARERCTSDFRPLCHHRLNRGDTHHRRVADDVIHLGALEDGLRQRDRDARLRRCVETWPQPHVDGTGRRNFDHRLELPTVAVEHAQRVAYLQSHYPRRMDSFISGQADEIAGRVGIWYMESRVHVPDYHTVVPSHRLVYSSANPCS